jgi:hypothetical protein
MSDSGKRNPDRLNMLGVVVVGVCGAVLVYVSIALLQAYYMNDTRDVETMADYGGQDSMQKTVKAAQLGTIDPAQGVRHQNGTFGIKIDKAIDLVVRDANDPTKGPAMLVPSQGRASAANSEIAPVFGRPKKRAGAGSGADAGSGAGAGSGSAAAPAPAPSPETPTPTGVGGGSNVTAPEAGSGAPVGSNGP